MKTIENVITGSLLIALVSIMPVQAQGTTQDAVQFPAQATAQIPTQATARTRSVAGVADVVAPLDVLDQEGTLALQEKVLMKINDGLVSGSLSAAEASQFKNQLNKLSDQESWYRTLNQQIPVSLIEKNTALYNELDQKLKPNVVPQVTAENALHADIDDLIGKALAHNAISSSEAERYYLRLAQIESNLAHTRSAKISSDQTASCQGLFALKSELTRKAIATK